MFNDNDSIKITKTSLLLQITAKRLVTPKERITGAKSLLQYLVGDVKTGTRNHPTNMTGLRKGKNSLLKNTVLKNTVTTYLAICYCIMAQAQRGSICFYSVFSLSFLSSLD